MGEVEALAKPAADHGGPCERPRSVLRAVPIPRFSRP